MTRERRTYPNDLGKKKAMGELEIATTLKRGTQGENPSSLVLLRAKWKKGKRNPEYARLTRGPSPGSHGRVPYPSRDGAGG